MKNLTKLRNVRFASSTVVSDSIRSFLGPKPETSLQKKGHMERKWQAYGLRRLYFPETKMYDVGLPYKNPFPPLSALKRTILDVINENDGKLNKFGIFTELRKREKLEKYDFSFRYVKKALKELHHGKFLLVILSKKESSIYKIRKQKMPLEHFLALDSVKALIKRKSSKVKFINTNPMFLPNKEETKKFYERHEAYLLKNKKSK